MTKAKIQQSEKKKIADYINKQKPLQKKLLKKVRKIFLKTLPDCKEEAKWGVIAFESGKFYLAAIKERVHVGFAINGLTKDEVAMFEGTGKTMRHIKIHSLDEFNEKKLVKLIRLVNKKTVCCQCH